jgi:hypothetical protein
MQPEIGDYYKHFKGNIYRIIEKPKHASDGNYIKAWGLAGVESVWYIDCLTYQVWQRELNDFLSEKILEDGAKIARFEKIKHSRDFPEM